MNSTNPSRLYLLAGLTALSDVRTFGRLAGKIMSYYVVTDLVALSLGMAAMAILREVYAGGAIMLWENREMFDHEAGEWVGEFVVGIEFGLAIVVHRLRNQLPPIAGHDQAYVFRGARNAPVEHRLHFPITRLAPAK